MHRSTLALVLLFALCCVGGSIAYDVVVPTIYGDIGGLATDVGYEFTSVPFAKPPIGNLRMRPPQEPDSWQGVYNGTRPAVACPQKAGTWTEDCLYMSIYVPKNFNDGTKRDVFIFSHGGAFVGGSMSTFIGRDMANLTNTIVISINYRLGILGLLGHQAFLWESGTYGNYLLMDQRRAFQWVRDNIRNFGGNPRSVTISGFSSGSISVALHAVSPLSWGLYHKAVGLSGVGYSGTQLNDRSWITDVMWTVLEKVNCTTLLCNRNSPIVGPLCAAHLRQCFRAVPIETLVQVQSTIDELVKPRPAVDGFVVPAQPLDMIKSGFYYHVPTLHAVGNNESTVLLSRNYPLDSNESHFNSYVTSMFGAELIPHVKELYPVGPGAGQYPTWFAAMAKIDTDWYYTCPTQRWLKAMAASGSEDQLYMYFSDYVGPWYNPALGTFHGMDTIYAPGQGCIAAYTPRTCAPALLETPERPLVELLQGIWTSMAKEGNPGMAGWPTYSAANNYPYLHISGVNNAFIDTVPQQAQQCQLWNSISV